MSSTPSPASSAVRRATISDAPAIKALIDLYVADGTLLPRTQELIELQTHEFLVAEVEGRLVGCVHLDEYAPSLVEIRSLAVAPGHQGNGLGRALVTAAEALGNVRQFTTVFAVSNDTAFFRKLGYAERRIPELDLERSEVSKFKGVYAKEIGDTVRRYDPK